MSVRPSRGVASDCLRNQVMAAYAEATTTLLLPPSAMFRRPGTGPSRASADTLCQKCLQRGHYSYECKASAQERPYKSRPSRTQQLLNPQLQPKLTTHVPHALVHRRGLADALLSQKEATRRRSRSPSSSVDSVSTISTTRSPSRSPAPPRHTRSVRTPSSRHGRSPAKRHRRSGSMEERESNAERPRDRHTRRRISSFSPGERGRPTSRSRSSRIRLSIEQGARRASRETNPSASCTHMGGERPASPDSRDRSPSPYAKRVAAMSSPDPSSTRKGVRDREGRGDPVRNRFVDEPVAPAPPQVQRERSLSPFSKRVALTRAMQAG